MYTQIPSGAFLQLLIISHRRNQELRQVHPVLMFLQCLIVILALRVPVYTLVIVTHMVSSFTNLSQYISTHPTSFSNVSITKAIRRIHQSIQLCSHQDFSDRFIQTRSYLSKPQLFGNRRSIYSSSALYQSSCALAAVNLGPIANLPHDPHLNSNCASNFAKQGALAFLDEGFACVFDGLDHTNSQGFTKCAIRTIRVPQDIYSVDMLWQFSDRYQNTRVNVINTDNSLCFRSMELKCRANTNQDLFLLQWRALVLVQTYHWFFFLKKSQPQSTYSRTIPQSCKFRVLFRIIQHPNLINRPGRQQSVPTTV